MPPRKTPIKRKKSSAAITPTPADHKSPKPEVETGAELADVVKVDREETLGQVELQNPNPAKIEGDSAASVPFSPQPMIKAEVVLENSTAGDVNEEKNEDGESDVGGGKVTAALPLASEDGTVCLENDKNDETLVKEKEDLQNVSENVDQDKQGSGMDGSQLETVAAVKVDNEDTREENAEIIPDQDSNDNKAPGEDDAALAIEDDFEDEEESDDGSEGDDADNEGDEEDPVPNNKKDKDIEIHVGGLDKNTVEDDLVNVFQQFGELKSTRIVRHGKKSKGFGFIRFVSPDQAKRALSELKDGVEEHCEFGPCEIGRVKWPRDQARVNAYHRDQIRNFFKVRGKRVKISESQDNDTLYLGNINKTWKKEEVLQQLEKYGIEHIETIRLPENPKTDLNNKGFAFLEFNTHSDAVSAFQRLKKPDAVFGRDISAKVAFAQTTLNQNVEDLSQVTKVYLEGLSKDWTEEKVKEICKKYGEIVKVDLCQNPRTKKQDFGFVTFVSNENALACVEGINNAGIGGDNKIKANFAKPHSKNRPQKQGVRGGFKVEKQKEASISNKKNIIPKETPEPSKIIKKIGGLNSQQVKRNKKDTRKNKPKVPQQKGIVKNGESSKKTELTNKKVDLNSNPQQRKRKTSPPNLRHGDQVTPKKPKFGGEGQNSKSAASKPGNQKRKGREREDGGNRIGQNKKPFKKQKGNMQGRERDNFRNSNGDNRMRRGHDDYRNSNSTRYIDPYAQPPPYSLSTRRFTEMEPHAGYIEPSSATHSRSYSGYVQPMVRTHNPHQTVYLSPGPASQSQSQSQLHSRYSDRPIMTQSHRGYIETAVLPEVQPFRTYQQSSTLQMARDPYDPGLPRNVRHDGRGSGVVTYLGGPSLPSSQIRNHTNYYQGGGSYSSQRTYY